MNGPVPLELQRVFLQKIVSSSTFARSEQLRRLLSWLGERAIEGVKPSEYDVGVSALQRPQDFDPQTDSLVRREMSRLRGKFFTYYENEGRGDSVCIACAAAYELTFHWSTPSAEGPLPGVCVMILPFRAVGEYHQSIEMLYESLLVRLSESSELQLISPTTARFYGGRSGDVRRFAVETGADFIVEGTVRLQDGVIAATLWTIDGRTGRSRQPCALTSPSVEDLASRAAECLMRRLIKSLTA